VNGEIAIIIATIFGCALFALGGTEIPVLGRGYKWLRRELLPLVWGILAFTAGFEVWRCVAMAVSFDGVFRLPYGDRTPKWLKFVVFMAYPLPSLFLGLNVWQAGAGFVCFMFWALSNWKVTEKAFDWVVSCLLMGAVLGVMVGKLIAQNY